ncbi:MAG: hypothetical protein AAGE80_08015 [Pseudomonadota bacterium]
MPSNRPPHATDDLASERCGDLLRHVVLPAGNLKSALTDYIATHRAGLDDQTLMVLRATQDVLDDISRKGRAIASDEMKGMPR